MKKDVKKSSYYVWFLGAHECKNVRDVDGALPAVAALADREKKVTPHKFTLQVSHRGLKIVHNVSAALSGPPQPSAGGKGGANGGKGGDQLVKHLIPDHAVTCVHRDGDLVAVILLLYNPVTRWPVHVHAYRCDSAETAALLAGQLRALVDRPENRKKLDEIELRLEQAYSGGGGGRATREPSASRRIAAADASCGSPPFPPATHLLPPNLPAPVPPPHQQLDDAPTGDPRVTALYDSLAAELKKKLGTGGRESGAPILLPPRDYDTVHRHRGNLNGIDFRRCMSAKIVGVNGGGKPVPPPQQQQQEFRRSGGGAKTQVHRDSSGGSSGIGSDHAPSPEQYGPDNAYADNDSSSDEDWNASPSEEPVFVKPSANNSDHHPLPRVRRQDSGVDSSSSPVQTSPEKDCYYGYGRQAQEQELQQQHFGKRPNLLHGAAAAAAAAAAPNPRDKYSDRNVALVQPRPRKTCSDAGTAVQPAAAESFERKLQPAADTQLRRRTPSPASRETPRERFKDAKEKFLMLEKERMDEQRSALRKCAELRQRRDNGAAAAQRAQVIRAAVRGGGGGGDHGPRATGYGSDDETATDGDYDRDYGCRDYDGDRDRDYDCGDYDDGFDGKRSRNVVRRSDRSRESLDDDRDYRGDGYPKPRRSRNALQPQDARPAAPRSYSADEYAERRDRNRPSPPAADRYKSPQRPRGGAAEAPRAAPRRNHNGYGDAAPSPRANDYKRRSAAYAAYDVDGDRDGGVCCDGDCSPSGGGRRGSRHPRDTASMDGGRGRAADDDGPPPAVAAGRDYKRRSAAAYDERGYRAPSPQPRHHQRQDVGGCVGPPQHGRRDAAPDFGRRATDEPPAAASVSPRYRHSYAEPYHHHAHRAAGRPHHQQSQRPPSPAREPPAPSYHRHGGGVSSLQPSGRIGIAAIHPY